MSKHKYKKTFYRRSVLIILFSSIVLLGNYWYFTKIDDAKEFILSWQSHADRLTLIVGGLFYSILLSLPFVPGVELGLLLMAAFGRAGILMVYLCTVLGLSLAYCVGRYHGRRTMEQWLHVDALSAEASNDIDWVRRLLIQFRIGRLVDEKMGHKLRRYNYILLALLFNMPGNYIIGGGGGIAMICGASRLIRWQWFLLTIVISTAPVPLLVWMGFIQLEFGGQFT